MLPVLSPVITKLLLLAGGVLIVLSPLQVSDNKEPPEPKPIVQKQKSLSREEYLEFHESRDDLQEKHSDY